jgi:hypothetical protein
MATRSAPAAAATSFCGAPGRRCSGGSYKADERYKETYWSKYPDTYFAGDGARIDEDGDFWLLGRVDDVMNVSGHRISTIEVESALVDHQKVAEAAVAGRADPTTGQAIVAFVSLKGGEEARSRCSRSFASTWRRRSARSPAGEHRLHPELPKTRSGRSCAGCFAMSPRTASSATTDGPRRTRRWSEELKTRAANEASGRRLSTRVTIGALGPALAAGAGPASLDYRRGSGLDSCRAGFDQI